MMHCIPAGNPQKLATAIAAAEELGVSESLLAKARLQLRHKTRKQGGRDRHAAKERAAASSPAPGGGRRPASGRSSSGPMPLATQPGPHANGERQPGSPAAAQPAAPTAEQPRRARSQQADTVPPQPLRPHQQPQQERHPPEQQRPQPPASQPRARPNRLRRASAGAQPVREAAAQLELPPAAKWHANSQPASPAGSVTPTRVPSRASAGSASFSRQLSASLPSFSRQASASLCTQPPSPQPLSYADAALAAAAAERPATPSPASGEAFRRGSSASSSIALQQSAEAAVGAAHAPLQAAGGLGPWGESSDLTAAMAMEQAALRSGSVRLTPAEIAQLSAASEAAAASQQEQAPDWAMPPPPAPSPPQQQTPLPPAVPQQQPLSPLLRPDDLVVSTPPRRFLQPLGPVHGQSAGPLFGSDGGHNGHGGGGGRVAGDSFRDSAPRGLGLAAALADRFPAVPPLPQQQQPAVWSSADGGVAAFASQPASATASAGLRRALASQLSSDAPAFQPPVSQDAGSTPWRNGW